MADTPARPQGSFAFRDVALLGQVFTPPAVVRAILTLRRHHGACLEPACGDGAFLKQLPGAVGIELDATHCPGNALCQDFFAYPVSHKFDTIIGNPPYVRFQDIPAGTRKQLGDSVLDRRSNLYLFFIEKCLRHLNPGGELIFITPRDFLKATSAVPLNRLLWQSGSITDAIELGDARVFADALPNCLIWRFEAGCQQRELRFARLDSTQPLENALSALHWEPRHLAESGGHLRFTRGDYSLSMQDIATVRVGAVSGADELFAAADIANRDFVYSGTVRSGLTRRMLWTDPTQPPPAALLAHKSRLLARRVTRFDENNWWCWGRNFHQSERPRIYVNGRTRASAPFFVHDCRNYDGSVLALFPHREDIDLQALRDALNAVDWEDLGFVCDGRHLFTQRSLQHAPLPEAFRAFLPAR